MKVPRPIMVTLLFLAPVAVSAFANLDDRWLYQSFCVFATMAFYPITLMAAHAMHTEPRWVAIAAGVGFLGSITGCAILYLSLGLCSLRGETTDCFWDCFYLSVASWTSLGHGDIQPMGTTGRLVSAAESLYGYLFLTLALTYRFTSMRPAAAGSQSPIPAAPPDPIRESGDERRRQ